MSLQFSANGPAFPEQLVDALLTGDVVFLCGAGVSAPQLPGFRKLVEQCFGRLHVAMSASDRLSFDAHRYEEVLGSLGRRIVDPAEMIRTVVDLLQTPSEPDLSQHRTVLRLSRDLENRPVIVTTNFDTMFEAALLGAEEPDAVRALSVAGQDLPAPGTTGFGGIIHIHGRIADPAAGLEQTPLVLTSADYGDAYMRSGWASRFLFDLCRCKVIVLVGYSAGDAPVRYFLNVLEADRERFRDLHPVFALDSVEARDAPDVRWEALAVEPIVYAYGVDATTGQQDHSVLWRDLARLADVVERPRATRSAWAQEILERPFDEADPAEVDRVSWLYSGRRDLWSLAIRTIEDARWLDFFSDRKLWSESDAAWIVAAWLARDLNSTPRFRHAIACLEKLGRSFAQELSRRIDQAKGVEPLRLRGWRLLASSQPHRGLNWEDRAYTVQQRLHGPVVLQSDLEKAVALLTPVLEVRPNQDELYGATPPEPPERLAHLARTRLTVQDRGGAPELVDALVNAPEPITTLTIASAKLRSVVGLLIDCGEIDEDYDSSEYLVPSVEPHRQNEHHDGPIFIVELLARLLPIATDIHRDATRRVAESWRDLPGVLGIRLWLHAMRNSQLFSADQAITGLRELPPNSFWTIRREIALVLLDRAADANATEVAAVEQRILTEGEAYYDRYTIEDGQADWRSHARDAEVWLRLEMLQRAGRLSDAGQTELAAIRARRAHLDRDVHDHDFFSSYSSEVRTVVGDAQPIVDAPEEDRLDVALEVIRSPDIEKKEGWNAYCRTDPRGAFDTLRRAPLDAANAPLWRDLISVLSYPQEPVDPARHGLVVEVFKILERADDVFLASVVSRLADLYWSAPRLAEPAIRAWWPRLFRTAVESDADPLDSDRDLYSDAINSAGGRLTQAAMVDIEQQRKAGEPIDPALLNAIEQAATAPGRQGILAKAALVQAAGFVVTIEGQRVSEPLNEALAADTLEGAALRSVLVDSARLSSAASRAFAPHILRGVGEISRGGRDAVTPAAKIMAPALSIVRGEQDPAHWEMTLADVETALRSGSPALREGAAEVLSRWIGQLDGGPPASWRTGIGPLLASIWPRERSLRDKSLTRHFANLAVGAGEAFPEALGQLLPYLAPLDGHGGLYAIEHSTVPDQFPRETLSLLWRLFGPGSTGDLYGIPKILERLIAAMPALELDRRLQWLDQRAIRYE